MIVYLAHPVRPEPGEDVAGNLAAALRWLCALHERYPHWATIATWIPEVQLYGDADEARRAAGLARAERVAGECDAVALCGPRVSAGMRIEARAAWSRHRLVYDFTWPWRMSRGAAVDLSNAMVDVLPTLYQRHHYHETPELFR